MPAISSLPAVLSIGGCLLIFGFFVWSLASVWRCLERDVLSPIEAARRRLPQKEQLADQWERYRQEVEKYPALRWMWQRYSATVVDNEKGLRSLRPASTCFVREALNVDLNTQLHGAMPNLLTGQGIFFTFFGLIIGIQGAESGVTAPDQPMRTAALETLLGGAWLAFVTSAVGLLLSLVHSGLSKYQWDRVDKACAKWARELDGRLPPLTTAEVAFSHLKEARASTAQLERFNTDLAISIATALDEQQARWLQPTLEKLIAAAEAMRENQVQFDERLSGELLSKFEAALMGPAQSKIELMATAMSAAAQQLDTSSTTIAHQQARWTEEMRAVVAHLREGVESAAAATQQRVAQLLQAVDQTIAGVHVRVQHGVSDALAAIQESSASLSGQLEAAAGELRGVLAEVQKAAGAVAEAAKAFAASKTTFARLGPELMAATDGVRNAAAEMARTMQSASQLQRELLAAAQIIKQGHGELAQLLTGFEARFAQVDRSAQGLFEEINQGLAAFTHQVREFLEAVDGHLTKAASILQRAIKDLAEAVEELGETLPKET